METNDLMEEIALMYGAFAWKVANRYATGILEPEDIWMDLMLELSVKAHDEGFDWQNQDRTKSYIISKSISKCRYERRRQNRKQEIEDDHHPVVVLDPEEIVVKEQNMPFGEIEIKVECGVRTAEQEIRLKLKHMDSKKRMLVMGLLFPPRQAWDLATEEHLKAVKDQKDGKLRMNVHKDVEVKGKHVAKALQVSNATFSRAMTQAKQFVILDPGNKRSFPEVNLYTPTPRKRRGS